MDVRLHKLTLNVEKNPFLKMKACFNFIDIFNFCYILKISMSF